MRFSQTNEWGLEPVLALGIDLGGSGFRIGCFDVDSGELHGSLLTHQHGASLHPEHVLPSLVNVLGSMRWCGPIGMGFPGAVEGNQILTAPNLGEAWCTAPIEETLRPFSNGHFVMVNDADAVAEGERVFGHGHDHHDCVLTLTVGTGLGTTVHKHGRMVPNLEYGRWPHPSRGGLLEEHLSGRARTREGLSIEAWCERFQEGLDVLEDEVQPTLIIVYGGIMEHWSVIEPLLNTRATLVPAQLTSTAGPLGAAWLARQQA